MSKLKSFLEEVEIQKQEDGRRLGALCVLGRAPHVQPHQSAAGEEGKMRTAQDHEHLSYSQINCNTTCPLKYRFNNIDR